MFFLTVVVFADKSIVINLSNQELTAIEDNATFLISKISTGRVGYTTPTGHYKVLEKERMHISNRYPIIDKKENIRGGAKMPYMIRVTNTGIAMHAGEMVDYPDSHGCIRLPYGKAMQLFKWSDVGIKIKITGKTPYNDKINKMRLSVLKSKHKSTKPKKGTHDFISKPVAWVDSSLEYYDEL